MSRKMLNRIGRASSEELLLLAVLGDRALRRAVDMELDRRTNVDLEAPSPDQQAVARSAA